MRLLLVFSMCLLAGCGNNCEAYCQSVADEASVWMDANLNGEEKAELSYYDEGAFQVETWDAMCEDAPQTRDCEECSSWVRVTFFSFAVEEDCVTTYTGDDPSSSAERGCRQRCRASDLIP